VTAFRGASALVVGGAGFVGSNLVLALLERDASMVVVVDNLLSSERENVPSDPRVELLEGSIADDAVLGKLGDDFDHVFHLATYHGNQSSIANPLEDHEHNLLTTLKLLERLKTHRRVRSIVYAASGCTLAEHTYGDARPTEEDGPVPLDLDSPYQISKVVGEFYSVYYHRMHGLPTVRARFQNVYGPREILGGGRWRGTPATVWRNVTPTFVYRALKGMPIQLDNGGVATRDFVYVADVVDGLLACAERGRHGDVYNLASGVETSIRELAETVLRLTGSDSELVVAPPRDWDRSGHRFGSTVKAAHALGFRATTGLEQGLVETVAWTREHLPLIERCVARHAERLGPVASAVG
jgi:nucleoside-diphosphate-sugar epimerase